MSVVIATRERYEDLRQCINSIKSQSVLPDELIIVDGGDFINQKIKALLEGLQIESIYIHEAENHGLPIARNIGIQSSSGGIVLFLDDDVYLEPTYIKNIINVFENDKSETIGGVSGIVQNSSSERKNNRIFGFGLMKLFIGSSHKNQGKVLPSGMNVFVSNPTSNIKFEFLFGCNMAYRRQVFKEFMFDETWGVYCLGEDLDFSYRVSKKYDLIVTPYAKLTHRETLGGGFRGDTFTQGFMEIFNRFYILQKNTKMSFSNWISFFRMVIGIILFNSAWILLRNKNKGQFNLVKGELLAIYSIFCCLAKPKAFEGIFKEINDRHRFKN